MHVKHECNGKEEKFDRDQMEKDEVSQLKEITAATWHNDYWTVSFRDAAGQVKARDGKQCNYEQDDAPQVCVIILYEDDFSIVTPATMDCYHNHY